MCGDSLLNAKQKIISGFWVLCLVLSPPSYAQSSQNDINEAQRKLRAIQQEISELENRMKTQDNQLRVETRSIENIDKQISLTNQKIRIYKETIRQQKKLIDNLEAQIDSLEKKIRSLQKVFKEQVVFAYKYQRVKQYDWLLGASSLNEVFVRWHHFKKVAQAEQSIHSNLQNAKNKIDLKEKQLVREEQIFRMYENSVKILQFLTISPLFFPVVSGNNKSCSDSSIKFSGAYSSIFSCAI